MRVSMIPVDGTVVIDGVGHEDVAFPSEVTDKIHAVQWYGTWGEVEFADDENGNRQLNERITDFSPYQQFVDLALNPPPKALELMMPEYTPMKLSADPVGPMDATTKRYVDEQIAEQLAQLVRRQ